MPFAATINYKNLDEIIKRFLKKLRERLAS